MSKRFIIHGAVALLAAATASQGALLDVSIGIRETEAGGGTVGVPIGGNGGTAGGIEFVNLDGQTLTLDGTFQTFTFNFQADALTAFAGTTANSLYDGTRGVLEHIRFRNSGGELGPISLYIDNVRAISPTGAVTTVTDFEGWANGTEVSFQEPRFSGSTSSNLLTTPNIAGVSDAFASQGAASYNVQFQFVDATGTRWVRLTTNGLTNLPNPVIEFGPGWQLKFDVRGEVVPEPASAAVLLLAAGAPLLRRRR